MRIAWVVALASLLAVAAAPAAEKSKTMRGKVTAVTADSVTIAQGTDSMTFHVDATTKITGKGLTTKTNEKAAKGEKLTLSDTVGTDDMVTVTYEEMGGKMHASAIRITQKSLAAK